MIKMNKVIETIKRKQTFYIEKDKPDNGYGEWVNIPCLVTLNQVLYFGHLVNTVV